MPICIDPVRQARQLWIGQQFDPAFDVESGLLC
jgi:hypothetical protein